ncbi:Fc.00g114050.m01.CDS01 [Cosmosporella sp. VM-42]
MTSQQQSRYPFFDPDLGTLADKFEKRKAELAKEDAERSAFMAASEKRRRDDREFLQRYGIPFHTEWSLAQQTRQPMFLDEDVEMISPDETFVSKTRWELTVDAFQEALIPICRGVSAGFRQPSKIPSSVGSAVSVLENTGKIELMAWAVIFWILWIIFKFMAKIALTIIETILSPFGIPPHCLYKLPGHIARFLYHACIIGVPAIINAVIVLIAAAFFSVLLWQLILKPRRTKASEATVDFPQTSRPLPRFVNGHFVKPPGASFGNVSPEVELPTEDSVRKSGARRCAGVIEWDGDTPTPGQQICGKPAEDCHHYEQLAKDLLMKENKVIDQMKQQRLAMKRKQNELKIEIKGRDIDIERLKEEQMGMHWKVKALESGLATMREKLELSDELAGPESQKLYDKQQAEIQAKADEVVAVRDEAEKKYQYLASEFERLYIHEQGLQGWIQEATADAEEIVANLKQTLRQAHEEVQELPLVKAQLKEYKGKYAEALQAQHHAMTRSQDAEERRKIYYDRMMAAEEKARISEEHLEAANERHGLAETLEETKKQVAELMAKAVIAKKMREMAAEDMFRA